MPLTSDQRHTFAINPESLKNTLWVYRELPEDRRPTSGDSRDHVVLVVDVDVEHYKVHIIKLGRFYGGDYLSHNRHWKVDTLSFTTVPSAFDYLGELDNLRWITEDGLAVEKDSGMIYRVIGLRGIHCHLQSTPTEHGWTLQHYHIVNLVHSFREPTFLEASPARAVWRQYDTTEAIARLTYVPPMMFPSAQAPLLETSEKEQEDELDVPITLEISRKDLIDEDPF